MKKFFYMMLALIAMPLATMAAENDETLYTEEATAEVTVDETETEDATIANVDESIFTNDEVIALNMPEETSLTEKYYKNWLGEKCIDFGDDNKLYYNWKRDVTYVGVPFFLSSFIIKSQKKAFRSARFSMDKNWKSEIDNYTQFAPYGVVVGLKALGYEGRSSWDRLLTSTLLSNAVMAIAVNATKYSVKEMRPDNSTRNSFPSGHTATAFVAATVLHKEYGLTRSPWFSVGGYSVAIATGFMRVLNNRHWISDVMAGAGIGIISTELGYFLGDLLYKNNGICRRELTAFTDPNHPSFFDIQMGIAMHSNSITFDYGDGYTEPMELGTSSAVGLEGAYFLNKYFGVGGMVRVTTTPTKGLGLTSEVRQAFADTNFDLEAWDLPGIQHVSFANNNFVDFSFDAGIYGNLPLSNRFSLGAKFLVGTRMSSGIEFKARAGYREQAKDEDGNFLYTCSGPFLADGKPSIIQPLWIFENADGSTFVSNNTLMPGVETDYNYHLDESKFIGDEYTLSKVEGDNSFNYVCGLSLTYRYKNNLSWKLFVDLDSSKKNYTYRFSAIDNKTQNDILKYIEETSTKEIQEKKDKIYDLDKYNMSARAKKRLNFVTIGAAFSVNF